MSERILIIDDEETTREVLSEVLNEEGYSVSTAGNGHDALKQIEEAHFDLALCDLVMPDINGIETLKRIQEIDPSTVVVIMTAFGTIENAVKTMKQGAADYIVKPFNFDEFLLKLKRIFKERRLERMNLSLKEEIKQRRRYDRMIGISDTIQNVYRLIDKIAPTNSTVLITGESGTGKELVARAIHENSNRKDESFLPVNCAAIPGELLESEFFGYQKGAFTDAKTSREGLFKVIEGGTLFLDEICSIPITLQAKLLRAIELKEIIPLGGKGVRKVDIRIITASNKNLVEEIAGARFREDLYYRLKVFEINLPPLRERKEDIPVLVKHFIDKYNVEFKKKVNGIEESILNKFLKYEWKGNIRELENIIERAMIMCDGEWITDKDLPMDFLDLSVSSENNLLLKTMIQAREKEHIQGIMKVTSHDKKKAAELLGLSLPSLYRKIKELNIEDGR